MIMLIISLLLLVLSAAADGDASQKLSSVMSDLMSRFIPAGTSTFMGKRISVFLVSGVSSVGLSCVLFWPTDGTRSKPGGGGGCSAAAADDDDAAASSAAVVVGVGSLASGLADPAP